MLLLSLTFILAGCSGDKKANGKYPVIDIVNEIGNYQRVYCSNLFSSIELIPLETGDDCLLAKLPFPQIILKDTFIFINRHTLSDQQLYAFGSSGKFLNPIGRRGQGPGEYLFSSKFFLNTEKPTIFVEDTKHILEYDFKGNHIRSFKRLSEKGFDLDNYAYTGDNSFVASARYRGNNPFNYCLLNSNGDIIKTFPNHLFYHVIGNRNPYDPGTLTPVHVKGRMYLKEIANDTIYVFKDMELQPAYVFGLGKYTYPLEIPETFELHSALILRAIRFTPVSTFVVTENFIFYCVVLPEAVPKPKAKPRYRPFTNQQTSDDITVYGIYNIETKKNILLDTDAYYQKGIVNDLNGGLPFIPIYYAGNNLLVGIWWADDMKEKLTDEYFAKQTIKDPQAYQKLKELLKTLKDDDNPVVVVAKLK